MILLTRAMSGHDRCRRCSWAWNDPLEVNGKPPTKNMYRQSMQRFMSSWNLSLRKNCARRIYKWLRGCNGFLFAQLFVSCFLLFIFLLGQKYLFELKLYKHTYYVDMVACPVRKIFSSLQCVRTCTGTREYSGSFSLEHKVVCARVKAQNLRCSKQPKWWAFIYNMHEES